MYANESYVCSQYLLSSSAQVSCSAAERSAVLQALAERRRERRSQAQVRQSARRRRAAVASAA